MSLEIAGRIRTAFLTIAGLAVLATGMATTPLAVAQDVRSQGQTGGVELQAVQARPDGSVSGEVVNKTGHPVRNVQLMVIHDWLWANEFNPGSDDAGTVGSVTVAGDIAAGSSKTFSYAPSPALPDRRDGSFLTHVTVSGYQSVIPSN